MKSIENTSIPKEKLHEGYNECQHKVHDLLKSSQILFDEGQFNESLALSILATEESTKLSMIQDHIKRKKPIISNDWYEITAKPGMHKVKLTKIQKELQQEIGNMTDEEFVNRQKVKTNVSRINVLKQLQSLEVMYSRLGDIKNMCFYVNWKTDWSTFSTIFPNLQDRKDLAYYFLILGWYEYYTLIFLIKYNIDNSNLRTYSSHPYLKQYSKFLKITRSSEFIQIFYKINKLLNEFKL